MNAKTNYKEKSPAASANSIRFSTWLKNARKEHLSSNADLARLVGAAPSTISMILAGDRIPSPRLLGRIARVLCPQNVSLVEFSRNAFDAAGYPADVSAPPESSVDRVLDNKEIRVAYVVSE